MAIKIKAKKKPVKKIRLKKKEKEHKPTRLEEERRKRINVALWAYAYEVHDNPIVSDATFDRVCSEVDPMINTGHKKLDKFFREQFDPFTGSWVHKHPELKKIKNLYYRLLNSGVLNTDRTA